MKYQLQRCRKCLKLRCEPCNQHCPIVPIPLPSRRKKADDKHCPIAPVSLPSREKKADKEKKEKKKYDLGASKRVLEAVKKLQPCRTRQIAKEVGKAPSVVNTLLKRMRAKGILIRSGSERIAIWTVAGDDVRIPKIMHEKILEAVRKLQPCKSIQIAKEIGQTVQNTSGYLRLIERTKWRNQEGLGIKNISKNPKRCIWVLTDWPEVSP